MVEFHIAVFAIVSLLIYILKVGADAEKKN